MNLPPVEAIDTIYRFALQQPRWRQLPQCWRFPLLQYIPFPRVAEVRGCCRISLQQRPSSCLLARTHHPRSLSSFAGSRRLPTPSVSFTMTAPTTKQLTFATKGRFRQDPSSQPTARPAMWPQHVQDVGTERPCMCHCPLGLASLLATSPPAAAATVSAGQLYPRPPSMPPLLGHLPPPR